MLKKNILLLALLISSLSFLNSCSKDEGLNFNGQSSADLRVEMQVYPLHSVTDPDISGTATFMKIGNKTKVMIDLDGTPKGGSHPAHIHFNSAAVGGGIAISLTPVNGSSGKSVTIISEMDSGTPITYEDLINFNGYINVHLSIDQLAVIVAQGDIGSNF